MKTVPVVPVATAATGVGSTSFTANWNAFSGASYYLLDVSLSSSFSTFVLQNTVTTATSYVVTGLTSNTTYYYRVRAAINVDSDVAGFVSRVYTAGGSLSYTEVTATETLVADLKSYGIWTAMKAVYPMVGASAAACAQNLVSASFTGTFTSGWTFASTGVQGNGTSAYMSTGLNPSTALTNNNLHIAYYSRTNVNEARQDFNASNGVPATSEIFTTMYLNTLYFTSNIFAPNTVSQSVANTLGFVIGNTTASNVRNIWKGGIKLATDTSINTTALPNITVNLGARANPIQEFSTKEFAFASIGDGLTDTQASNFYTAVQTFNQTLNRQVGAQIVSDADAQAYINRVYTAGGTLTNTEANAVNQLTIDMKAAGIWTSMKAVYPMVGASAAACAQNLKSSSFTGSFTSGWTFSSTGVTPNGTSAYMDTGLVPNTELSLNSAHISSYSRTNSAVNGADIGSSDKPDYAGGIYIVQKWSDGSSYPNLFSPTSASQGGAYPNTQGFFLLRRNNSTEIVMSKNAVNSTIAQNSTTKTSVPIALGALRQSPATGYFSNRELAFASIGDGLTDTQAADFYTCVQNFNTSLSRQV